MKKILVTGASGFIGNHLINELLKYDVSIVATSVESLDEIKKYEWSEKVDYIQFNLNDLNDVSFELFNKPDQLIHLAWEGLPNYKELYHFEKNLFSNYNFIKKLVGEGLQKVSVIGTCFEYGMQEGCLSEEIPTSPSNPYGLAKDSLRKFIHELSLKINFEFNWFRLFYIYGKGQSPNSLLSSLERAIENGDKEFNMSPGDQIRDFISVNETVEIIAKLSLFDKECGIVNCCSGNPITVKEMVENKLKEMAKNIKLNLGHYPYPELEPFSFWGNRVKLNSILHEIQ